MDELLARHRKELRDLQSVITSKKKQASKKTRKSVNTECETLERELKEKHEREVAELNGGAPANGDSEEVEEDDVLAQIVQATESKSTDQDTPEKLADDVSELSVGSQGRKPNRQKARLARRAAEQLELAEQAAKEAASLPNLREQEQKALQKRFDDLGLVEQDIPPDGHCLYSAFADQLLVLGKTLSRPAGLETAPGYKIMRRNCADFVQAHRDDFEPFLETAGFEEHVDRIANTAEWGGQLEVSALAQVYEVTANIVQAQGRIEKLNEGKVDEIWLAYHRHNFGLGEHYNSLRKKAQAQA